MMSVITTLSAALVFLTTSSSNAFVIQPQRRSSPLYSLANNMDIASSIRFLGKGTRAIVREGCVLIAPPDEFNHYLMQASVFIYAIGLDEYDEQVIRGVVLDNPTPFTMGEMAGVSGSLAGNLLYRGGNTGGEVAMMLHSESELKRDEIGTSGIYEGGLELAMVEDQEIDNFKFFFNYCEFSPIELETMLETGDNGTDGDAWTSVEVPKEVILEEWDKNECWRFLRNVVRSKT